MNWMKLTPLYFFLSALIIVPGIYSLARFGLKLGIEFTGGTRLTLTHVTVPSEKIIAIFADYSPVIEVQQNDSFTLKMKTTDQSIVQELIEVAKKDSPQISLQDFETIGPALGQETIKKTINALALASFLLLAYISLAFKQLKYGLCAILAMFHDTAVLLGSFSLLGHFLNIEVDLLFVTAVLTILSFSVHDTIVVYDRIRELAKKTKDQSFVSLVNQAVTETMIRSLNNSLTIIFMLISLFLLGGESTKFFALALL